MTTPRICSHCGSALPLDSAGCPVCASVPPAAAGALSSAGSPLLVAAAVVHGTSLSAAHDAFVAPLGLGLWLAGLICALAVPERGMQDYVAGTWLVPR